jgi:small-conductance mechanosensitive channel
MAADKEQTVEERVVAFAEQLGRLIGTVESKTEGWINQDQKAFRDQLTQLRDGAAELLSHLGGALSSGRDAAKRQKKQPKAATPVGRSGGTVDAPGKTHRKMAKSARGAKHSDERISKIKGAKTMRRGHRRG